MNSNVKRAIIESWFAIDYTLFKTEPKKELSESEYKNYLVSKGAFLSNLFEMYGILKYTPKDVCYNNLKELKDFVEDSVATSKSQVTDLMKEVSSIKSLKEEVNGIGKISGLTETEISSYVVSKRQKALILDSILLKTSVENSAKEILEGWKFKVLFDSHKLFRDSLIDVCFKEVVDKIKENK